MIITALIGLLESHSVVVLYKLYKKADGTYDLDVDTAIQQLRLTSDNVSMLYSRTLEFLGANDTSGSRTWVT